MTAARQQRKSPPAFWLALGLSVCGGIFAAPAISAAPSDRIVVKDLAGLAVSGFDPVAYFTDANPKIGRPDMELRLEGAVWRFRNEGNLAAFAEHPEVYSPRFGGYDPVAIACGASVRDHPLFWTVTGESGFISFIVPRRARPSWLSRAVSSSALRVNGSRSRAPSHADIKLSSGQRASGQASNRQCLHRQAR